MTIENEHGVRTELYGSGPVQHPASKEPPALVKCRVEATPASHALSAVVYDQSNRIVEVYRVQPGHSQVLHVEAGHTFGVVACSAQEHDELLENAAIDAEQNGPEAK